MEIMPKYFKHFLTQLQQEFMLLNGNLLIQTHNNFLAGTS